MQKRNLLTKGGDDLTIETLNKLLPGYSYDVFAVKRKSYYYEIYNIDHTIAFEKCKYHSGDTIEEFYLDTDRDRCIRLLDQIRRSDLIKL